MGPPLTGRAASCWQGRAGPVAAAYAAQQTILPHAARPLGTPEMSGLTTNEIAGFVTLALLLALVLVFLLR